MKSKTWIALLLGLLAVCAALSIWLLMPGQAAERAEVWLDGALYKTVDLGVDQEFTVRSDRGSNTVTVKDGKIAVTAADCPDHYCMERGFCGGGTQIVCLPNRLVIKFVGEQDVDGVVG
ncbi:MAG: NusG domain II-containing protein [Oscillospiraceae bacterium]|nr:NusG domain II-containing protein [Oscillospiraceae bacterium]